MYFQLFLFSILKMVYASSDFILDNFEIKYTMSAENVCHEEIGRFQIKFGFSIQQCVEACGAREHCQALNYRSRGSICELFKTLDSDQLKAGDCLYVAKEDIDVIQTPCQNGCTYGEVCESDIKGHGICVIRECVNETVPENGTILGNQMEVGNKIRYKCNTGFSEKNSSFVTIAECLDTGKWSSYTECFKTNYTWDSWSSWSTCSLSCGSGSQSRSRGCFIRLDSINEGSHCQKSDVGDELQTCNEQDCPTPTYGKTCTNNEDCIEKEGVCIEGICFCDKLYKYDMIVNNCTKECEAISGEFEKYADKAITGFNIGGNIRYDTVDDCKEACSNNPECLSFEAWPETGGVACTTGSVTYDMIATTVSGKINPAPGTDLYSKTCN